MRHKHRFKFVGVHWSLATRAFPTGHGYHFICRDATCVTAYLVDPNVFWGGGLKDI